jgi:hypothetical protein
VSFRAHPPWAPSWLDAIERIEARLDLTLAAWISGAEEIEEIGILEDLLGHVGVGRREALREGADRLAVSLVRAVIDLEGEDVARPTCSKAVARTTRESRVRRDNRAAPCSGARVIVQRPAAQLRGQATLPQKLACT